MSTNFNLFRNILFYRDTTTPSNVTRTKYQITTENADTKEDWEDKSESRMSFGSHQQNENSATNNTKKYFVESKSSSSFIAED